MKTKLNENENGETDPCPEEPGCGQGDLILGTDFSRNKQDQWNTPFKPLQASPPVASSIRRLVLERKGAIHSACPQA